MREILTDLVDIVVTMGDTTTIVGMGLNANVREEEVIVMHNKKGGVMVRGFIHLIGITTVTIAVEVITPTETLDILIEIVVSLVGIVVNIVKEDISLLAITWNLVKELLLLIASIILLVGSL